MDWLAGLVHWRVWLTLAMQDVKNRYRRSSLGPIWITLTMGITILAMGPLYGGLFGGQDPYFVPKMGIGLIVWSLMSQTITESVECFTSASNYIKNIKLPYSVYIYRLVAKQLILFAHNIALLIPIYFFYPELLTSNIFYAIFGLGVVILWLTIIGTLVAILCTRYRDLGPLITNIMQLLFFVTPIVWPVSQLTESRKYIVNFNPVYYLLEMVREPLMGIQYAYDEQSGVILISIALALLLHVLIKNNIKRLSYWL